MHSALSLQQACFNYHIPLERYQLLSAYQKQLVGVHIHISGFRFDDLFVVATIQNDFHGMWSMLSSVAVNDEELCASLFVDTKLSRRAQFRAQSKEGLLVAANGCSDIHVNRTFDHITTNQQIKLYDLQRDGAPLLVLP